MTVAHTHALEPTAADVALAAQRLAEFAAHTPLLHAPLLSAHTGGTVYLKAENLQIGGSFKFRGACNRLVQLDTSARARGVVAWSSGNHGQAVAIAGTKLGIPTTIVMPKDAPRLKIENTKRAGAEIVFYDRHTESREEIGRRLTAERGATLVPSYDDRDVIAGQGTTALEIVTQLAQRSGAPLDALLVPCGGGGLIAGCAIAAQNVSPHTKVYAVEPDGFDDTARSLVSGRREHNAADAATACDALMAPTPGTLTLPINQRLLAGGLSVTDAMVFRAIAYAWRELKLVIEPGGAVALAAILNNLFDCRGMTVVVVLSGGNVDADVYDRALQISAEVKQ